MTHRHRQVRVYRADRARCSRSAPCMLIRERSARGAAAPRCSAALLLPLLVLRVQAQPAAEAVRRAVSRRARHHRAQPARRPSGADRDRAWWRARWPIRSAPNSASSADEITYGADLETAMRNLYFRVGQEDLPLFVTAVAIQGSTGGNLSEILENLSARDPPALQDAAEDPGARRRRPRSRRCSCPSLPIAVFLVMSTSSTPRLLRQRLARGPDQDGARLRRRVDADRQPHHVPHGATSRSDMD